MSLENKVTNENSIFGENENSIFGENENSIFGENENWKLDWS